MRDKQQVSSEVLESQLVEELPERQALNWSLIFINLHTGNINVLSYNNLNTCVNAAANALAGGNLILQRCVAN